MIKGNFTPYIISYIRNRTDETSLRNVDMLWVNLSGRFVGFMGMSIGGLLDVRFGPRIATLFGALLYSGSVALSGLVIQSSFPLFVFTFGVLTSFGVPCAYGPPIQTAIKWLPNRSSLASGLIVAGFGGGAIIFNQVITVYINPDNLSPDFKDEDGERYFTDAELLNRVPTCFMMLGAIYYGILLIGIVPLTTPRFKDETEIIDPEKDTRENDAEKASSNLSLSTQSVSVFHVTKDVNVAIDTSTEKNKLGNQETVLKDTELTVKEAVKLAFRTRSTYLVCLNVLCMVGGMSLFISLYKAYGQTFILDDHFLAQIGSLSSVFNCIGRPVWGVFMDRFGYKVTIRILSLGLAIFCATISLTEGWNKVFYMVWVCGLYIFYCGIWATNPAVFAKLFGAKNMAVNYGIVNVATAIASVIGTLVPVTLRNVIGWHGLTYLSASFAVLPVFYMFLFNGVDREGKNI